MKNFIAQALNDDRQLRLEELRWRCYAIALYGSALAIGYRVLMECL